MDSNEPENVRKQIQLGSSYSPRELFLSCMSRSASRRNSSAVSGGDWLHASPVEHSTETGRRRWTPSAARLSRTRAAAVSGFLRRAVHSHNADSAPP